jgi:hypothetical protein
LEINSKDCDESDEVDDGVRMLLAPAVRTRCLGFSDEYL